MFLYSNSDMISSFCQGIGFSNIKREENVILELCSEIERAKMNIAGDMSSQFFYFYMSFIDKLRVLIPLTSIEGNILMNISVSPY